MSNLYLHRSTHNNRIERLWVEVGSQFVRAWRAFFYRLERLHNLDAANPFHLWLVHFLFLQEINDDCDTFSADWNVHDMASAGNRSPQVSGYILYSRLLKSDYTKHIRLEGFATHGVPADEFTAVHPDMLDTYLGVAGQRRSRRNG